MLQQETQELPDNENHNRHARDFIKFVDRAESRREYSDGNR